MHSCVLSPPRSVATGIDHAMCRLKHGQLRGLSVPMGNVQSIHRPYSCGTLASTTVGEVRWWIRGRFEAEGVKATTLPVAQMSYLLCAGLHLPGL